jgi:hypothetical protein
VNRLYLRQAMTPAAVEAMGPLLLSMTVQDMTRQIPAAALPSAEWQGWTAYDPITGELHGYAVDVVWPEVEYV